MINKNKMKKFCTIILLNIFVLNIYSQNEFLTRINPSNLSITSFDSIPTVAWILNNTGTIDETNHRYFFIGTPANHTPITLYTMNSSTGAVIYNPIIPSNYVPSSYVGGLEYDNNTDTLYGFFKDGITNKWFFAWIDYTNGFVHPKDSLVSSSFGSIAYDKNHHRFFYDYGLTQYILDAHTGHIINSYVCPHYHYNVIYNNVDDRLYCTGNPNSSTIFEFDSMEVTTGILHNIANVPFTPGTTPEFRAIDEIRGRYFTVGMVSSIWSLYTIDIHTGNILSSPLNTHLTSTDYLAEFVYDNVQDTLFALHWGPSNTETNIDEIVTNNGISVFPNPFTSQTTISFSTEQTNTSIKITDILGKEIKALNFTGKQCTIEKGTMQAGIYFLQITDANKNVANRKIVVQ